MRKSTLFNQKSSYWPEINQFVVAIQTEDFPETEEQVKKAANGLVTKLKLTKVNEFVHPFSPYGITLVYVLSESHLAIHTWPERKVLHIDLVTCSRLDRREVEKAVKGVFNPDNSFFEWLN